MNQRPLPDFCKWCDSSAEPEHWKWQKDPRYQYGGTWKCKEMVYKSSRKYAEQNKEERAEYQRRYYLGYSLRAKVNSYRNVDKKLGRESIGWPDAEPLMLSPCNYCGLNPAEGLDRRDNSRGHEVSNVVPCCSKCNNLLSDIPAEAKDALIPGLIEIREKGLMDTWIPPQFRKTTLSRQTRQQ